MLHDEGNRRAEDGGGDYYRRELELQRCDERHQMDINPIDLKVRGDDVEHPKPDYHARDELGILQKCRQVCTPPVIDRGRFDRSCQIYLRRRHRGIGNLVASSLLTAPLRSRLGQSLCSDPYLMLKER
jgi:hypothetical protein